MIQNRRNITIIAHVDHGKTTLVDKLLQQSGTLDMRTAPNFFKTVFPTNNSNAVKADSFDVTAGKAMKK